jgi:phage-related minor tail protein
MTLAQLLVKIGADPSGLSTGLTAAERNINQFAARAQSAGAALTAGLTGPILAIGGAAFAAANSVDSAMDEIRTGTGATGAALEALGADFHAVATSVPTALADASTAIAELNKRTGQTGEGLQDLAAQELNLARITKSDLQPLIASTTRAFADWGIGTSRQSGALDYLYRASQATGAGVSSLAEKVVQFGAPLRQLGFSFEQSVAMLGKFEKEGVNVDLVLGSLRRGLAQFAKAGVDAPAALQAVINRMQALGPGTQATALALKVFGARAGPDMAAAITEGRLAIDGLVQQLTTSTDSITAAAADTDDWGESLQILRNKAVLAFGAFATPIIPIVTGWVEKAISVFSVFAGWLESMTPHTRSWVIGMGAAAAAVGPLLLVVGSLTRAILTLRAAWIAFQLTAGPVGWITLAVGALAALAFAFFNAGAKAEEAARRAQRAIEAFKGTLAGLRDVDVQTQFVAESATAAALTRNLEAHRRNLVNWEYTLSQIQAGKAPDSSAAAARAAFAEIEAERAAVATLSRNQVVQEGRLKAAFDEMIRRGRAAREAEAAAASAGSTPAGPQVDLSRIGASAGEAADKLAGARDAIQGLVRDFAVLARFPGIHALSDLPDEVQQQVRQVQQLSDQVAQAQAHLAELGTRAPAGGSAAVAALNAQLAEAERRLNDVAAKFNANPALASRTHIATEIGPKEMPAAQRTVEQKISAQLDTPLPGGLGSLFGDVPAQMGLLSTGIAILRESVYQAGRAVLEFGTSQLNNAVSGVASMAAQFTPAGLAAYALSSALEAIRPFVEALLLPIRIFGEIMALALVPVLRLLFPVIKAVAIVFAYLQEGVNRVVGGILWAAGKFVAGLGKLINAITPFASPGNPLIRAGEAILKTADNFFDAADEIAKKRKELENLNFNDALEKTSQAADRLSESLLNAVQGFKANPYRFAATDPQRVSQTARAMAPAASAPQAVQSAPPAPPLVLQLNPGAVVVNGALDPLAVGQAVLHQLQEWARSSPEMRKWVASIPTPGYVV